MLIYSICTDKLDSKTLIGAFDMSSKLEWFPSLYNTLYFVDCPGAQKAVSMNKYLVGNFSLGTGAAANCTEAAYVPITVTEPK